MKYNLLGLTGLKVSQLCLGTMAFGGRGIYRGVGTLDQAAADAQVRRAVEAGINFLDTANVYSDGLSEEITGQAIRNLGLQRDALVLATKVCGRMGPGPNELGLSRKHILQQVEGSLRRLNTDYIDLYQLHGYDPLTPLEETLRVLDDLVRSGKVRYLGASNLAAWQLMKALASSERQNLEKFVSLQAYYSLAGRELERELIPLVQDQQLGLLVWSPLAAGLLSGKYTRGQEAPVGGRLDAGSFIPVDRERAFAILDRLRPMAAAKEASEAQLALAWLLHQPTVSSLLIGATRINQLEDNLRASAIPLTPEELQQLDDASQLAPEYPGWLIKLSGQDRLSQTVLS
ncbi:aldo/keto reductase [Hymenobacter volaticus]|uniref:Aldo/keto reductase n=1 Tax=Hymenobacter volaticus TaxID=2932254 RepID=A0ABY4GGM5_9BACT|nr:aldo/keto reductase [Hymenobacter volaticus]UOQ69444.1 aldo/keto reductase [Hymenobacter volaticus]